MLNNRFQEDKTYEELLTEALTQIPFYSEEWTNRIPSDPGITILENLTAFEMLQQNRIHEITPAVLKMLLKLAGFESRKGRCARVLLAASGRRDDPLLLPANQQFRLGDLCFETNRNIRLPACRLTGVYRVQEEKVQDVTHLLDREVRVPAYVFGRQPGAGASLWITADALPSPGEELIFYITVADRYNRNPFGEKGDSTFARIRWECYTEQGFVKMHVRDDTGGLLVSGELRMRLPDAPAAPCREAPGGAYVVRAVLEKADYDVRPKLVQVDGFLFEAWQKETLSACYTFNKVSSASLPVRLLGDGYVTVFCKEEKGSSYKKYEPCHTPGEQGRFFEVREEDGQATWLFDRKKFGYGPSKVKNAIKIVVYQESMMRRYTLGTVLGCDHQLVRLPAGHLVAESFCIIAERKDEQGEAIYDFVRPGRYGEKDLSYDLYENDGYLIIEDAGDYIGASLYMGAFALTRGAEGNIRKGNTLTGAGLPGSVNFYNPKPGTGGCYRETLEEVKKRFVADLKRPFVAVTAEDYERLVMGTPKLCIRKVRAYVYGSQNLVRIAVMPGTDEAFPGLSDVYRRAIARQLEERRLLTTRIEILPPVYTPVDVQGTIYVKRQYENSLEQIEEAIRRKLDFLTSGRNFGEAIKFDQIFHEIESLDCVEFIYELSLYPQNPGLAKLVEADIVPGENCLCYAGNIRLQTG